MLTPFAVAWKWVGGLFSEAISTFFKYSGIIFAYFLGKRRVEVKQLEDSLEIKDKQLDETNKPALHRNDLIDRMRDGKF